MSDCGAPPVRFSTAPVHQKDVLTEGSTHWRAFLRTLAITITAPDFSSVIDGVQTAACDRIGRVDAAVDVAAADPE